MDSDGSAYAWSFSTATPHSRRAAKPGDAAHANGPCARAALLFSAAALLEQPLLRIQCVNCDRQCNCTHAISQSAHETRDPFPPPSGFGSARPVHGPARSGDGTVRLPVCTSGVPGTCWGWALTKNATRTDRPRWNSQYSRKEKQYNKLTHTHTLHRRALSHNVAR